MISHVLVIDDSIAIQKVMKLAFAAYHVSLYTATSVEEAQNWLKKINFQLILADADCPGIFSPKDFLPLKAQAGSAQWVFLEGTFQQVDKSAFEKAGVTGHFFRKPFESKALIDFLTLKLHLNLPKEAPHTHYDGKVKAQGASKDPLLSEDVQRKKPFDVEVYIREEIERLLPTAIENFCLKNFSQVATQVIRQEIDRLTEEKTRLQLDP